MVISLDSKRAIHVITLREVEALFTMPGMYAPASFTSVIILSDLVLMCGADAKRERFHPTLVVWKSESIFPERMSASGTFRILRDLAASNSKWRLMACLGLKFLVFMGLGF